MIFINRERIAFLETKFHFLIEGLETSNGRRLGRRIRNNEC